MGSQGDISERLAFLSLGDEDRRLVRAFRPIIQSHIDEILTDFYRHLRSFPAVASFFGDDVAVARAKAAQTRHWVRLFSADFNDEYMASVREVGRTHNRIGLHPQWYVGGYARVLAQLLALAVSSSKLRPFRRSDRERLKALQSAVTRAVMLDIELALSIYLEEQHNDAEAVRRAHEAGIVAEVTLVAEAASSGDLDRRIALAGKDGFLFKLCAAVNTLVECTGLAVREVAGVMAGIAEGNLTGRVVGSYGGVFATLKADVNRTAERLTTVVGRIHGAAGNISTAAAEVADGSQDLSQRSEEQATALEAAATSLDELAAAVKQNSASAQQANRAAAEARAAATTGGEVVSAAIAAMANIEASSGKIGDIVGMIDAIAFQTNLLALNASVEAARAGDSGRGFAVVAQEVRNLAQRSADASREIKALIASSSLQVAQGADLVKGAGGSLAQIVTAVVQLADIVSQIASASAAQAGRIDHVSNAVGSMDETTQQNAALVEQAAAAAMALEDQARQLREMTGFFHCGKG